MSLPQTEQDMGFIYGSLGWGGRAYEDCLELVDLSGLILKQAQGLMGFHTQGLQRFCGLTLG